MNRWQRVQYHLFSAVAAGLTLFYLRWWFDPARLSKTTPLAITIVLLAALTFVTFHRPFYELYGWIVLRKIKHHQTPAAPWGLKVALITTYVPGSEPLEMLRQTLTAMRRADYPHATWLLDEGNDPEARKLCQKLGVFYFTRHGIAKYNTDGGKFAAKTKGGNHNAWYDAHGHQYDVVAQFDTDFIVSKDVFTSTLGYFNDPKVAFVGTPQVYDNMGSWIARGAAEQTYLFYGPIMRGLGDRQQGLLIGANHIVRVAALKDIGWYFAHLAEDLATGMTFHSKGWKSVYTHQVLAKGEGPSTWSAYFTQQYRWAFGCLDLLFRHAPRLVRTMPIRQALRYLWMQGFYLNGLAMATGMVLLGLYFTTGISPANMPLAGLALHYLPILVWRYVMMRWVQRFNARPKEESGMLWAGRLITIAALPVYLMAFIGVVRGKRMTFKVTQKGESSGTKPEGWRVFKPHLGLTVLLLSGMTTALLLKHTSGVFLGWAGITIVLFVGFMFAPTWLYWLKRAFTSLPERSVRPAEFVEA